MMQPLMSPSARRLSKHSITEIAFEALLHMNQYMLAQRFLRRKRRITCRTSERSFARMLRANMNFHMALCREAISAQIANMITQPLMYAFVMSGDFALAVERFATFETHVGPLTSVRSHMHLDIWFVCEILMANRTLVWFLATMNQRMSHQIRIRRELTITYVTVQSFLYMAQ